MLEKAFWREKKRALFERLLIYFYETGSKSG